MTAVVFLILLVSHLLGDWVLQSDWQAINKSRCWAALTAHVASYHLAMGLLLLIPILRDGWPVWKGLVILALSGGTHAVIDRRWPVRALLRATGSPGFATVEWGVIAVDHALHLCILALLAVLLGWAEAGWLTSRRNDTEVCARCRRFPQPLHLRVMPRPLAASSVSTRYTTENRTRRGR